MQPNHGFHGAARGKATEADSAYLSIAARTALDSKGVGAVTYRDR